MGKIDPKSVPWSTSNAMLAFCLRIAGIPLHNNLRPCVNIYDAEMLFIMGGGEKDGKGAVVRKSRYSGMSLEDAANRAFVEGKKGHVTFQFKPVKGIGRLSKVFAAQEAEINATDKNIDVAEFMLGIMQKIAGGEMPQDEGLVRIACVNLKLRGAFMNAWKQMVPRIRIPNEGQERHFKTSVNRRGRTIPADGVEYPGAKIISLDLSEEKRKHLKL